MKKIDSAVYNYANRDELISKLIDNQNEIINWISDHGEYVILKKPPIGQIWQLVER